MYKPTDRQAPLFEVANQLPSKAREAIKGTWAEVFRQKVFPILLRAEDDFADLYDSCTGRSCRSIARKLGMLFMQQMHDLTDKQIVANALFDARYQYALQVTPEEAYLSRQSLSDFRRRLVEADPEMKRLEEVFVRVSKAMVEDLDLDTTEQRTDATRIVSNIETKGRKSLFRKTIDWADRWIGDECPERRSRLPDDLLEWLEDESDGEFGGEDNGESLELETLAGWAYCQKQLLVDIDEAKGSEVLEVLSQLLDEHCIIEDNRGAQACPDAKSETERNDESAAREEGSTEDNGPSASSKADDADSEGLDAQKVGCDSAPTDNVDIRESPKSNSDSLQSPYDPDAGFRPDKGPGYNMHITETCNNDDKKPEALTDIEVEPMDTDTGKLSGIVGRLHARNVAPDTVYADAGYGTAGQITEIRTMGTEPKCPISRGNQPEDRFGRERFQFREDGQHVDRCPQGKKPYKHGERYSRSQREGKARHAYFYPRHCESCPKFDRCPVRPPDSGRGGYLLELHPKQLIRDKRLAEQKTEEFKQQYAIRTGVEGTASELKRRHGVGQLRVRRLPKVKMKAVTKAAACNVKRWAKWLLVDAEQPNIGAKPFSFSQNAQISPRKRTAAKKQRRSSNRIRLNGLNVRNNYFVPPFEHSGNKL